MAPSANRRWAALCLGGIGLWIGVTVAVTVINDDPGDGAPVLLAFAGGGTAFFGAVFGAALWQTRPPARSELDALLAELAIDPVAGSGSAREIGGMQRVARVYLVLGAVVTALGLAAIVEAGLGVGSARATLYTLVAIVVAWALAVPWVIRRANRASSAVLAPLGLTQSGAVLSGERHGRSVRVEITSSGSTTRLAGSTSAGLTDPAAILAYAGRGDAEEWAGVRVEADGEAIVVRRLGHRGPAWLWDLWLAERLAADA